MVCAWGDGAARPARCPETASVAGGGRLRNAQGAGGSSERARRLLSNRPSDRRGPGTVPGAAMCVQDIDVQCVLQFTLIHAAGCALHRHTSRVIHRLELSFPSLQEEFFENPLTHPASGRIAETPFRGLRWQAGHRDPGTFRDYGS